MPHTASFTTYGLFFGRSRVRYGVMKNSPSGPQFLYYREEAHARSLSISAAARAQPRHSGKLLSVQASKELDLLITTLPNSSQKPLTFKITSKTAEERQAWLNTWKDIEPVAE